MKTRTFALAALAAAIVSANAAPAIAAPRSVTVKYDDLDLSTPQGQAKLDQRVDRAAKGVCTTYQVIPGSIRTASVDDKCYQDALAKLKAQLATLTGPKQQG
ncbi:MAG: UrcA family protein [Croceibacterium sp.]